MPEQLPFWAGGEHELDFVVRRDLLVEVKRGSTGALEFAWFPRSFPKAQLWVVGRERFTAGPIRGITATDLLLDPAW